jgi:hypothetical protein
MIYTGDDRAQELNFGRYRDMLMAMAHERGKPWNGKINEDPTKAIHARIDFGRWIGDCPCGAACYVSYNDPIFYCAVCGNAFAAGNAVRVIIPESEERERIEAALEERELAGGFGAGTQFMLTTRPKFGLASRSWNPGESAETLRAQYAIAKGEAVKNGI